jgi:predicted small lipoprotein YifL
VRPTRIARVLLLCLLTVLAAGCGQRGPLYLPQPEPQSAPQSAPQPAPPPQRAATAEPEEADGESEEDRDEETRGA